MSTPQSFTQLLGAYTGEVKVEDNANQIERLNRSTNEMIRSGQLEEAKANLERTTRLAYEQGRAQEYEFAVITTNLKGLLELKLEDPGAARLFFRRALRTAGADPNTNRVTLVRLWYNLSRCYRLFGKRRAALHCLRLSMSFADDNVCSALTVHDLAQLHTELGNVQEAQNNWRSILQMSLQNPEDNSVELGVAVVNAADALYRANHPHAAEALQIAIRRAGLVFGEMHVYTRALQRNLDGIRGLANAS
jgi:tetratricopeptide (TPR) repeat protein